MNEIKDRIKKGYSRFRGYFNLEQLRPARLIVEKAKWYRNASSPVVLMIDDLANAWHGSSGAPTWDPGGDWGGGLDREGSTLNFLEERLLKDFPEVRITFFTVAGATNHYTHGEPFAFSEPLNHSDESVEFFRRIHRDDRFEIAYHGYNHGTPGARSEDFVQEWQGFGDVEEGIRQTEKGMGIFKEVFGSPSRGGKYGGWGYNEFSDESIDRCGFYWWCRDWMPRDVSGGVADGYYEPQFFGKNLVVALPTTVHGFHWDKGQVDKLIESGQIIAIEEHISPVRPDGLVQTPNVHDDITELKSIYRYLRGKDVWHATCSEVADYFAAFSLSLVYDVKKDGFKIKYSGRPAEPLLTLIIDCSALCDAANPCIDVTLPGGGGPDTESYVFDTKTYRHQVTVPVRQGEYRIAPRGRGDR